MSDIKHLACLLQLCRQFMIPERTSSHKGIKNLSITELRKGCKMLRLVLTGLLTAAVFVLSSQAAFAVEAAKAVATTGGGDYVKVLFAIGAMLGAGLAMGVGAVGAGLGIGTACSGACQAVGRNPGVQGKIMMTMLIGMAMAESIAIYALVISLVLLFANPFMKFFLG
jgi:F-type H+-transporting ATPase subunit c